ncbi:hypothetical protein PQ469_07040 [Mucilaginibacter sp. KACC 22773]|uniref:hypothetical protein n=1 Tax=Mucilaginibacter sp. KACC 22773 TaxID=3025671 RepID=UPI002366E402|nr:hypothetical protein [Mucilaginibacter sp. KACC 22773]WDF79763.1 hypothetical protein PQ469_07040 [Mucilaginibacter sp. KACC 22773]
MEIEVTLIKKAFSLVGIFVNNDLDKLLLELSNYDVEQLLFNRENNPALGRLAQQLSSTTMNAMSGHEYHKLASVIVTIKPFLDRFILGGDISALVIFVMVNSYFKIDLKYFLQGMSFPKTTKDQRITQVQKILSAVNMSVSVRANGSYYEKELERVANQGTKENSVKKIYDFVLAIERGGQGFHFNFYLENLVFFLFQLNVKAFIFRLNNLKLIEEYIFYLQSFPERALVILAKKSEQLSNPWVIFELTRQLLKKYRMDDEPAIKGRQAIALLLQQLYLRDEKIYHQAIPFFHSNSVFNVALGEQMQFLSEEDLIKVMKHSLPIDRYNSLLETRTKLLTSISLHTSDDQYQLVLNTARLRWQAEFDRLFKSEEFLNDLFMTSYGNFIIHYYSEEKDVSKIKELLNLTLKKLVWIDSEWVKNESEQITRFYLYFSLLFLLSHAYKNKKLIDEEALKLFDKLKGNPPLSEYITNEKYFKYLNEIAENFNHHL